LSWRKAIYKGLHSNCIVCGNKRDNIADILGICVGCIREETNFSNQHLLSVHDRIRRQIGFPSHPPKAKGGFKCNLCSNNCIIGEGEKGYCGLRWNDGEIQSDVDSNTGLLYAYLDPHVTNCCGAWFCPGGTGAAYPFFARTLGPEYGYKNLAVFFYGCNFNCLYCQNSSHKELKRGTLMSAEKLAEQVELNKEISCICFFGGSPEPQLPFSIKVSELAEKYAKDRVLRFCWEWNGCGDPKLVSKVAELALVSGGNVKFDLKYYTPSLSLALSGVDNSRAYSNFEMIAKKFYGKRPELPVLTATTLMVPGYVDSIEVESIAGFIARFDKSIPYSLLVFHPDYVMNDLPVTSIKQVKDCYVAASKHLENVHVGNLSMLGIRNMRDLQNRF
jgi:pyruvate formate lyase activating enzyme